MEERIIRANTPWMRLAITYGGLSGRRTDICSIRLHIVGALFNVLFLVGGVSLLAKVLGLHDVLAWLTWMLVNGQTVAPSAEAAALGMVMAGLVCIVALMAAVITGLYFLLPPVLKWFFEKDDEPSAFALAYRSWKDKACYPVYIDRN